ncbi:hypothetical protein HCN73_04640 [Lactobacillus crispatus]|jgi:hypothetical protein|nr:hypothetical protein [Lactobacillus crispatus]MBA2915634.1 hypothetical protein [Lactobacillus crispatus]MBM6873514.1 hypothetical protein [Lactobacillus crispatus]OUQ48171.1 hypothetical protein B5E63_06835 [Lactobacillus gallinarum]
MMVRNINPTSLTVLIKFGKPEMKLNEGTGNTENTGIKVKFRTRGRRYSLPITQQFEHSDVNWRQTFVYVVHHRRDWSEVTYAEINGQMYQVTGINPDSANLPTSYDQVTLTRIVEGEESDG